MGGPHRRADTLVTGGAGFIGSWLVAHLVELDRSVVVIDDLTTGSPENLSTVDPAMFELVEAPVSEGLQRFQPGDFTAIHHLAAAVGVRLVIEAPIRTIETNVLETAAVLRFATEAGTPVLLASSSEVYGKSESSPFHETQDVVYGPTVRPRWAYACSKAIDEHLALAHHRHDALPACIVRFFNIVGPRQSGRWGMVLPRFVAAALEDRPLAVHGDGRQTRCFCDVRDVVPILPRLLEDPACAGRIFNLGSDEPIMIGALAELVVTTLGSNAPIEHVSYESVLGPGMDDMRDRQPDLARIHEATGFTPGIPLRQTILDIADMLRARPSDAMA